MHLCTFCTALSRSLVTCKTHGNDANWEVNFPSIDRSFSVAARNETGASGAAVAVAVGAIAAGAVATPVKWKYRHVIRNLLMHFSKSRTADDDNQMTIPRSRCDRRLLLLWWPDDDWNSIFYQLPLIDTEHRRSLPFDMIYWWSVDVMILGCW